MADHPTCTWTGESGAKYKYYIWELPTSIDDNQVGNYIYSKKNSSGKWVPIYIGQGDLSDRVNPDNHHQELCIKKEGATHIHMHLNENKSDREAEEEDLLANYTNALKPNGCNEQNQ